MVKEMTKTFVVGDVHGQINKLKQVIDRANISPEERIVFLGDFVDHFQDIGGNSKAVIDFYINLDLDKRWCIGNHDIWFFNWMQGFSPNEEWLRHGGAETIGSFSPEIKEKIKGMSNMDKVALCRTITSQQIIRFNDRQPYLKLFLSEVVDKFEDENGRYIHAGMSPRYTFESVDRYNAVWDRTLIRERWNDYKGKKTLYIGHTSSITITNSMKPVHRGNIIDIDTGSGSGGKLTIIEAGTTPMNYWQSD